METQEIESSEQPMLRKILAALTGIIIGAAVAMYPPVEGLDVSAMRALGVLSWAILWWVFDVIPEYVTSIMMCTLFVILGLVPTEIAFASFSGSTFWMLLGALGLGVGISESGLLVRIALYILRIFPSNFKGKIIGLLGVGVITAPFVPSLTAKVVMLAPITEAMSDALGYKRKGREASALFLAMFTGVRNMAPVFLSASVMGYLLLGLYPPSVQAQFNMIYWFLCALPWGIAMSILNYFSIIYMFKPEKEQAAEENYVNDRIAELGPMNKKERIMLGIIILTVFLWAAEPWHGIASHLVALLGLSLTLSLGVFDRDRFRSLIAWDSLIFICAVLNLTPVFKILHINEWILAMFSPIMQQLTVNPYLFILGLALITVIVRFVIISEMAFISIFMVFLVPLVMQAGINPWVAGMIIYVMVTPWFVLYENSLFLAAHYSVNGEMVEFSEMARFCVVYLTNSLIALLLCVPYWQYLHLLP